MTIGIFIIILVFISILGADAIFFIRKGNPFKYEPDNIYALFVVITSILFVMLGVLFVSILLLSVWNIPL